MQIPNPIASFTIRSRLLIAVIFLAALQFNPGRDAIAADNSRSHETELNGARYILEEDPANVGELMLRRESALGTPGKALGASVSPSKQSVDGFECQAGWTIKSLKLTTWNGAHLLAVVVRGKQGLQEADVLLFHKPPTDLAGPTVTPSTIYSSPDKLLILAVNGEFEGDGIVVVLGTLKLKDGVREAVQATILINDCPLPGMDVGKAVRLTQP